MLPIQSDIIPLPKNISIISFWVIDFIFIIGIILLIVKRNKIFNGDNDVLDKNNSNKIKGLLAILIVVHHLSIYIRYTVLFKIFTTIGIIIVAIFFFYSGYGLMSSYLKKENYLKKFFSKRIMKVLIPYIIAVIITFLTYLLTKYKLTPMEIFNSFFDGEPVVRFSWYVLVIFYFYVIFYITAKILKEKSKINIAIFIGTILYCLFATNYLSLNNWWVNSCFSFFIGVYWASYKDKYIKKLKNNKKVIICSIIIALLSAILVGIQFLTSGYSMSQIKEFKGFVDYIMKSPISIIFMNIICISLMMILFRILKKVNLNDRLFNFLGNISFEIYLYHGIVMYLLRNQYCYLKWDFIYAILVIVFSIILAKLMNIVNQKIYTIYNNCSNKVFSLRKEGK